MKTQRPSVEVTFYSSAEVWCTPKFLGQKPHNTNKTVLSKLDEEKNNKYNLLTDNCQDFSVRMYNLLASHAFDGDVTQIALAMAITIKGQIEVVEVPIVVEKARVVQKAKASLQPNKITRYLQNFWNNAKLLLPKRAQNGPAALRN